MERGICRRSETTGKLTEKPSSGVFYDLLPFLFNHYWKENGLILIAFSFYFMLFRVAAGRNAFIF